MANNDDLIRDLQDELEDYRKIVNHSTNYNSNYGYASLFFRVF